MKKLSLLRIFILIAMFGFNAKADIITLDGANEIANAFFANSNSNKITKGVTQLEYLWDSNALTSKGVSMMKSIEESPTFYVFNNPDGEGFVIVSAESGANAIIGYSYDTHISSANEIPEPMKEYLLGIDKEIKYIRENVISSNIITKAELSETGGTQKVYLQTANWGQNSPFNTLCPVKSGVNCKTGCVPTAFSIVMRYHKWPVSATGTVYDPTTGAAVALGHTYDWDSMPLNYSNSWTDYQKTQVATLMRDVGFALGVTYGTGTTDISDATSTANFLIINNGKKSNFNYKSYEGATGNYATSDAINDITEWKSKIENSLNSGYPIPYAANNSGTGDSRHMFVLDGYTDNGYYHFNWGWNGSYNGWFQLTAMTPDAGDKYSWGAATGAKHRAYFNLIPNAETYPITVTATPANMGTVSINGGVAGTTANAEMFQGATATLTAYPADGYALAYWSKNGAVVGNKSTIEVQVGTSGNDYIANFDLISNVLVAKNYLINPTTVGLSGSSKVSVVNYITSDEYPATLSLSSTSTSGSSVSAMSRINNEQIRLYAYDQATASTTVKYTLSVPEGYVITEYSFDYSINSTSYPCTINYSGGTISSPSNTQWYSFSPVSVNAQNTEFTLTASKSHSSSYFYIKNFTVGVAKDGGVTPTPTPTPTKYTAKAIAGIGGVAKVNGATSVSVTNGSEVTFVAIPAEDYEFVNWIKGTVSVSTAQTYKVTVTEDIELTANFKAKEQGGGEVVNPEYCTPSGNYYADNFLTSVTTTGAKENISYTATSHPGGVYKLVDGVIKVERGASFTLNLVAKSLGAGSSSTVREDIRYCHASLFTDFDIDGSFGTATQTWGMNPPQHNVYGNYDECMNISAQINVPETSPLGKSRIRVIYTNAWSSHPQACTNSIDKGIAYDFEVEVVDNATSIEENSQDTSHIYATQHSIRVSNYTGQLKVVNISGQVVAEIFCNQTTQIDVCKGVYIVITDNGSYKVVVFNK